MDSTRAATSSSSPSSSLEARKTLSEFLLPLLPCWSRGGSGVTGRSKGSAPTFMWCMTTSESETSSLSEEGVLALPEAPPASPSRAASLSDCGRLSRLRSSDSGREPNSESKDIWAETSERAREEGGSKKAVVVSKLTTRGSCCCCGVPRFAVLLLLLLLLPEASIPLPAAAAASSFSAVTTVASEPLEMVRTLPLRVASFSWNIISWLRFMFGCVSGESAALSSVSVVVSSCRRATAPGCRREDGEGTAAGCRSSTSSTGICPPVGVISSSSLSAAATSRSESSHSVLSSSPADTSTLPRLPELSEVSVARERLVSVLCAVWYSEAVECAVSNSPVVVVVVVKVELRPLLAENMASTSEELVPGRLLLSPPAPEEVAVP